MPIRRSAIWPIRPPTDEVNGAVLVAGTTAANAGIPADKAGLAAGLLNASQQLGTALGLAIFSAIATARTGTLLAAHAPRDAALTAGFHRALLACAIFLLAAAVIALRAVNSRGEPAQPDTTQAAPRPGPRSGTGRLALAHATEQESHSYAHHRLGAITARLAASQLAH